MDVTEQKALIEYAIAETRKAVASAYEAQMERLADEMAAIAKREIEARQAALTTAQSEIERLRARVAELEATVNEWAGV